MPSRDDRAEEREYNEQTIPVAAARQINRGIFYRYLSILAVVGLGILGYLAFHSVKQGEDPCSANLHGLTCQSRTCVRLHDTHFKLTPYCDFLLDKVRKGQQALGPGAGANDAAFHDLATTGGKGGGSSGSGPHPGGASGGAPAGGSTSPPASAQAPLDIHLPALLPVPPICTGVINLNC